MTNGRYIGFVMLNGRYSSHMGFMEAGTKSNEVWMMSMIFILSLLALMVVRLIRCGAGNRGGRVARAIELRVAWTTGVAVELGLGAMMMRVVGKTTGVMAISVHWSPPNLPLEGQRKLGIVSFTGKYINENIHKKTLKAIARDRWPRGAVDSVGKSRSQFFDDEYYKDVLDEFQRYYDYEEGVPVAVARYNVKEHLKNNLKNMMSWELRETNKRVQDSAPGTTRHDVKPVHIPPAAWDALCDWWDSPKFQHLSKQNKQNRSARCCCTLLALLVKGWNDYTRNYKISEANTFSPTASPPMSPNKRQRAEAEVACSLSKELGTQAHWKNRLFMGSRANLSDIYSGDELLVQRNPRLTPTHGASLSHKLLQRAIRTAAIIVHAYDSDVSVARMEIEDHIQRLATNVIPRYYML